MRNKVQQPAKHDKPDLFIGHTVAARGTVVYVISKQDIPPINRLLHNTSDKNRVILEVMDHIDGHTDTVRCIALTPTAGLGRRDRIVGNGDPIKVPVGEKALGRMFNFFGQTIDNKPDDKPENKPENQPADKAYNKADNQKDLVNMETRHAVMITGFVAMMMMLIEYR